MYEQWKLGPYELKPAPRAGLQLSCTEHTRYVDVLQSAFRLPTRWYGPYEAWANEYDWVVYVQDVNDGELRDFLAFAQQSILFPTPLDECWCLDGHMVEGGHTATGDLVYNAKTYGMNIGNATAAQELASLMSARFARRPAIRRADAVLSVPANPPKHPYNLPSVLAAVLADGLDVPYRDKWLIKNEPVPQLKNLPNPVKLEALRGAYFVKESLAGLKLILVDDLVFSGSTLGYLGQLLKEAGAATVIGVAATKTMRT